MVRWGGGKAEKLFLGGCSLIFVTRLASPLLYEFVQGLMSEQGMSYIDMAQTMGLAVSLPMGILSLAGFVCLAYAFWVRFWRRKAA
jgi:hypothetical protein